MSACASLPPRIDHAAPKPASDYAAGQSLAAAAIAWPGDRWWRAYGDAQLDALIAEGLAGAPDIRIASARILRADALAAQAGAAVLPTIDGNASVQAMRQSYSLGLPAPRGWNDVGRTTLDFSWELDFWGKNRAALAAATSETSAARAEDAAARLMLSASIAARYADLAALYAERTAASGAFVIRNRSLALIDKRRENGLEDRSAVERARSAMASAKAELAATDEALTLNRNALAALLGAGPDRGRTIFQPRVIHLGNFGLPADASTALLGRRPDIAAARLRTEAAASRIRVARAGFYPSINLSAFIGLNALSLANLADSNALVGSTGPAISLPIFRGGALRGRYREAEAEYDEAVARYDGAVVQALREVADVAASSRALTTRLDHARAARTAAAAAWQVATDRYRGGLATYLDVLTAEDALVAAQRTAAALEARGFTLDVALVRALGGGFRDEGVPT